MAEGPGGCAGQDTLFPNLQHGVFSAEEGPGVGRGAVLVAALPNHTPSSPTLLLFFSSVSLPSFFSSPLCFPFTFSASWEGSGRSHFQGKITHASTSHHSFLGNTSLYSGLPGMTRCRWQKMSQDKVPDPGSPQSGEPPGGVKPVESEWEQLYQEVCGLLA